MPYGVQSPHERANTSQQIREQAAAFERAKTLPAHNDNGDEFLYDEKYGNFSKGLPHNKFGVVHPGAYRALHRAVTTGVPQNFENIPLGGSVKLVNPQGGLAFDLEGADSHALSIPPSPTVAGAERAAEMVELYWMALCRDIPFVNYAAEAANPTSPIAQAIADLNSLGPAFKGPFDKNTDLVTPQTLFRGDTPGELVGPYISQFFLQSAGFGDLASPYDPQSYQGQLYYGYVDGTDYMTDWDQWLKVQDGNAGMSPTPNMPFGPNTYKRIAGSKPPINACDKPSEPEQRDSFYLYNGRMGTAFVHVDELYQAYFMAALNLLDSLKFNSYDPNLPYQSGGVEAGFGTFGNPHVATLVAEVATRALKAQWYQKWFVHRTLRPEAYGGMVHAMMSKKDGVHLFAHAPEFPIHPSVLASGALKAVSGASSTPGGPPTHSYLLPMAFPEGSPQHPSYGSGHATVAGACATIIKAFFDEDMPLMAKNSPLTCIVQADETGKKLIPYTGTDASDLTIMTEANKIAGNVGMFRNHAGVHWRSDHVQSILLGEQIAISILQDQKYLYNEPFAGWTFTTFAGDKVVI